MKKNAMTMVLATAFLVTAMPKVSFAEEKSMDQILQMKKEQGQQAQIQILNLKAQLSDMQSELQKEQNKFGLQASKWTRNIAIAVAGVASVLTVIDYKTGTNRNFLAYGLVTGAAGLVAGLGQVGVMLTDDQVVTLGEKIKQLQGKISALEVQLN